MAEARVIPIRSVARKQQQPVGPAPVRPIPAMDEVPPQDEKPDEREQVREESAWERGLTDALAFVRKRLTGDYEVDEFGFDRELTDTVLFPPLRPLYEKWFRVETIGLHNVPAEG